MFGETGPYLGLACLSAVLGLVVAAVALVGLLAVAAAVAVVVLLWIVIAGLLTGAVG
jgi:hypothetical protein